MWIRKVNKLLMQTGSRFHEFCTMAAVIIAKFFLENKIDITKKDTALFYASGNITRESFYINSCSERAEFKGISVFPHYEKLNSKSFDRL
jgi:hypothetical protein